MYRVSVEDVKKCVKVWGKCEGGSGRECRKVWGEIGRNVGRGVGECGGE